MKQWNILGSFTLNITTHVPPTAEKIVGPKDREREKASEGHSTIHKSLLKRALNSEE